MSLLPGLDPIFEFEMTNWIGGESNPTASVSPRFKEKMKTDLSIRRACPHTRKTQGESQSQMWKFPEHLSLCEPK